MEAAVVACLPRDGEIAKEIADVVMTSGDPDLTDGYLAAIAAAEQGAGDASVARALEGPTAAQVGASFAPAHDADRERDRSLGPRVREDLVIAPISTPPLFNRGQFDGSFDHAFRTSPGD